MTGRFIILTFLLPLNAFAQSVKTDPGSLDALQDIVVPAAVTFWPPAPAWYVLALILILVLLRLLLSGLARRKANRYRREASEELAQLAREGCDATQVSQLLKRVAFVAAGREQVASLSGMDWATWLNQHCPGKPFQAAQQQLLAESQYRAAELPGDEFQALLKQASLWINHHRIEKAVSE